MKRIYISLGLLFFAMVIMAYFYFTKLNLDSSKSNKSLYAAAYNAGIVFSVQNDKSVYDILKGQDLLQQLVSEDILQDISSLKTAFFSDTDVNSYLGSQNVYLSFSKGKDKTVNYLISMQLDDTNDPSLLIALLKKKKIKVEDLKSIFKINLPDSTTYYIDLQKDLLLVSNSAENVLSASAYSKKYDRNSFVDYINSDHTIKKNSLASVYINFKQIPELLTAVSRTKRSEVSLINNKDAFTSLSYNFSKERLLFNGSTLSNKPDDYLSTFLKLKPQKITIDNILPDNTANYKLYAFGDYNIWKVSLDQWLSKQKENNYSRTLKEVESRYRINLEEVFPKYISGEIVNFQLSTSEKLGAIKLSNGDRFEQQLLEISETYSEDIKLFKVSGLFYNFFGEPFKEFKRPFYSIIDNYLIIANNASTIQDFLNNYKKNNVLSNTAVYTKIFEEISKTSNVIFYANLKQSLPLFKKHLLPQFYNSLTNSEKTEKFETLTYQLSSDQLKFQTNLLLEVKAKPLESDSLSIN
jgi:hypothetical protein